MSDSRILVQLLDRGDELTVDTSELLQIDKRYKEVHAFAQPFRLFGYEDSVSHLHSDSIHASTLSLCSKVQLV